MSRNKYPEQTVEKILDCATKFFIEKGYEQTSIQDILDNLQLSKGGLYHHFKSKEEILLAVMRRREKMIYEMLYMTIRKTKAKNAKEKLKKIFYSLMITDENHSFDVVLSSQIQNPYIIVNSIKNSVSQDAKIIAELIQEGVDDGSLQTSQPTLCAEVLLLLINVWINPSFYQRNADETLERLYYLQHIMKQLDFDIIDEALITSIMKNYKTAKAFL